MQQRSFQFPIAQMAFDVFAFIFLHKIKCMMQKLTIYLLICAQMEFFIFMDLFLKC